MTLDIEPLLVECRQAQDRMSAKNPHKHLLYRLELALMICLKERSEHLRAQRAAEAHAPQHVQV